MKSLRFKIISAFLGILLIGDISLVLIARTYSSRALSNAASQLMDSVRQMVANDFLAENNKNITMLQAIAQLDYTRDGSIDLWEKCQALGKIADMDPRFENIGYYDLNGNSYTHAGQKITLTDRDYLKAAWSGKTFVGDPFMSYVSDPNNGQLLQNTSVPVYGPDGKVNAALVSMTWGDTFSNLVSNVTFGKASHPIVFNRKTGLVIASEDVNNVKNGQSIDDFGEGTEFIQAAKNGEVGGGSFSIDGGIKLTMAYGPIEGTDWAILCTCPYEDFFGSINSLTQTMIIALAGAIILSIAVLLPIIFSSLKPLVNLKASITDIASGNADLTKRINVNSADEVGDVVKGFNLFVEKLQTIIAGVKNSKNSLGVAGQDLVASTEDTGNSINQILSNINSVSEQINIQSNSVHQTAGAVNQIASNIESLERMIENQSSGVAEASSAVEEMIGNINSVNSSVDKMADSFSALTKTATEGSQKQQDVNERVSQIESQSEMLQEANLAIASIAEQTNLLAMNAAIEAAHAGEAGKGFSVVADEIRKLSETSSAQSRTIGDQLKSIKESIGSVVTASQQSSAAFQDVTLKIAETDELVRQIKAAMEEQAQGSQQISDALHSMNDSTMEVRTASHEMAEGNKAILEEVRNLQDATGVMDSSVQEMSASARKINETGVALSEISEKLESSIGDIGTQIDQFKV